MTKSITGQEITQDQVDEYLIRLRRQGIVNMFGAIPYIQTAFELSYRDSKTMLYNFLTTFEPSN